MIHGYKTKVSSVGCLIAAGLMLFDLRYGLCVLSFSLAIGFYGLHWRTIKESDMSQSVARELFGLTDDSKKEIMKAIKNKAITAPRTFHIGGKK